MKLNLFVPCVSDAFLPEVAIAALRCLTEAGFSVAYNPEPTCCGQVFLNSGRLKEAKVLAQKFVRTYAASDYVVMPSWSCLEVVREGYGELISDVALRKEWEALRKRVFELTDFLTSVASIQAWPGRLDSRAILHWSCHMPRDEDIQKRLAALLLGIEGLTLLPPPPNECCGFGGAFTATWREVSAAIGQRRLATLNRDAPDLILLAEPGCLFHLKTVAKGPIRLLHVAEVLALSLSARASQ